MDKRINVYIDAITGEILGGGELKTDHAGVFGSYAVNRTTECVRLARDGFSKLGYIIDTELTGSYLRDDILNYLNGSSSYGFYITCHGNPNTIGDGNTGTWSVNASDIHGNFHLVFLDACSTAADRTWANAFKCDQAGRGFLGWRTDVQSENTYLFCQYFWTHVGSKPICSVAVDAATAVPGAGTTPIVFVGDRNWYGYAY